MNAFIEHHQPAIRFDYSFFDRILLSSYSSRSKVQPHCRFRNSGKRCTFCQASG